MVRYAVQGVTPDSHLDLADAHLERIVAMGYDGVTLHFGGLLGGAAQPTDISKEDRKRLKLMLERHGLEFAYCWGYWAPLVARDSDTRRQAVERLKDCLRLAYDVGTRFVVTGAGSNDYRGGWHPHPENWTDGSFDRLCSSVDSVVATAKELDVVVSLKGHVLSTLDTPETLARAVDAVGSDHVVGSIDPVNQMRPRFAFESRRVVDDLFDRLGANARVAHVKDYHLDPAMVISLHEVPFGTGWLDVPYYLERVASTLTDPWFVVEHVPDAELEAASTRLQTFKALATGP